ncbi:MAG TPA: glycerophosphodiester phosphodiesterase family protein, partial [Acidimicrobiia bacterium]
DGLAEPLADLIDDLDAHDRLIVGSFSDTRITEIQEVTERRVPVSCGPTLARLWVLASRVGRGAGGDIAALQLPARVRGVRVVDEKLVAAAHASDLHVHVWTVNQTSEMHRFLDMGVDGLITDRPDRLRDVMIERELWN